MIAPDPAAVTDARLRDTLAALDPPPGRWALLALGGYGRSEMEPFSDVDLQFLVEGEPDGFESFVQGCLHELWDAGLKLGYATRTADDTVSLARANHHTATSLLDMRRIAGDSPLVAELHDKLWEEVYSPSRVEMLEEILDDRAQRHSRYGDTVFLLEPDLKSGEGGLRDLHGARWAARLARGHDDLSGLGITAGEGKELDLAFATLRSFRAALHAAEGRRGDRLHFQAQRRVIEILGFEAVPAGMQTFWQAARRVRALSRRILDACRVEMGLEIGRHIGGEGPLSPRAAVALFRESAERDLPLHPDRLAAAAATVDAVDEAARCDPDLAEDLFALLTWPGDGARPLGHLHDIGLLSALIPEWDRVRGLYQHNVFHVYTVDVHTLHGIVELKRLAAEPTLPGPGRIMADLSEPERRVLSLALLLHDIGKGGADPDCARSVARRLSMSEADSERVAFLVREHLLLALLAQTRDIRDEATVRHLAREVVDRRTLRMLYLLTWADMSSANPDLLTGWKAGLLQRLFEHADDLLDGGLGVYADDEHVVSERRAEVLRLVLGEVPEHPTRQTREVDTFIGSLPTRYAALNGAEQVLEHLELSRRLADEPVALALRASDAGTSIITVCCRDSPGLLARLSGTLAAHDTNIIDTEAFSRTDGHVIDEFRVVSPVPWPELSADLTRVATGEIDPSDLLRERERPSPLGARPSPPVETTVTSDDEASVRYTVIDVVARDRPGLLYRVARSLHAQGLDIRLARVSTEGAAAHDAFYVEDVDGRKLSPGPELEGVLSSLREAIEAPL